MEEAEEEVAEMDLWTPRWCAAAAEEEAAAEATWGAAEDAPEVPEAAAPPPEEEDEAAPAAAAAAAAEPGGRLRSEREEPDRLPSLSAWVEQKINCTLNYFTLKIFA